MNKFKLTCHIIIREYLVKTVALIVCAATVLAVMPAPALTQVAAATKLTDSKVQNYEDQLARIEKEMTNIKSQIATSKKNIETAIQDKTDLDTEITLMMDKIDVTNSLIAELANSIAETEGQIGDRQLAYEEKYRLFKERLRVTYEDGQASYLEMLFDAGSLSDFLSRIDRIGAMLEYDNKIMNELKNEKSDLESVKADLEAKKSAQEQYAAQLKLDEAALQTKSQEAQDFINKLNSDKSTYQAMQAKNEALRIELEEQLEAYIKELEAKQTAKYVGGTFMWPLPLDYTTVSSYCAWRTSPITGRQEFHNGIDIPAPLGTNVYASNAGTVVTATKHYSYGNYIMIDHGGGYITLYAHNSQLLVSVGDKVTKGQVIAKVGSTGDSTGNHCHFTMRKDGAYVNPLDYFN